MTYAHLKAGDALLKVVRAKDSVVLASASVNNVSFKTFCTEFLKRLKTNCTCFFLFSSEFHLAAYHILQQMGLQILITLWKKMLPLPLFLTINAIMMVSVS